jgi:hypothetical protein
MVLEKVDINQSSCQAPILRVRNTVDNLFLSFMCDHLHSSQIILNTYTHTCSLANIRIRINDAKEHKYNINRQISFSDILYRRYFGIYMPDNGNYPSMLSKFDTMSPKLDSGDDISISGIIDMDAVQLLCNQTET